MNAKINSLEFQAATLEEAKAINGRVKLYHSFCTDYDNANAQNVDLECTEGEAGPINEWTYRRTMNGTNGPVTACVTMFTAEHGFLTLPDSIGRPLVAGNSQRIFRDALDVGSILGNGGLNCNEHGYIKYGHLTYALDHSPLKYAGAFDFTGADLCEFLPAGKPALNHSNTREPYTGFNQQMKIGKGVRYVLDCLGYVYTDQQVEEMVNRIKAHNMPVEIKMAKETGYSISEVYDMPAACGSGSLEDSCMRGHGDYYYDLDEFDCVDLAYALNDEGELLGRALVWKSHDGPRLMDRIYGQDKMVQAFKNYAKENDWWHKAAQAYDQKRDWIKPNGEEVTQSFTIGISMRDSIDNEQAPYMDTFCYYVDGGFLTNSTVRAGEFGSYGHELRNTDGTSDERSY